MLNPSLLTILSIASLIFLLGCGVVDTEQTQNVVDLKARILDIQTTQVDPLIEDLQGISSKIGPLETEIEELENTKLQLYEESDSLAQDFEDSMQTHFTFLFTQSDDLKREQEAQINKEFEKLDQLHEQLSDEWNAGITQIWDTFDARHLEIDTEIEKQRNDAENAFRQLQKDNDIYEKDLRQTLETQIEEKEAQVDIEVEEYSKTHPGKVERQSIDLQWKAIEDRRMELDWQSLDQQEKLNPIQNIIQDLQREQESIMDQIVAVLDNAILSESEKAQQKNELTDKFSINEQQIKSLEEERDQKIREFQSIEEQFIVLNKDEIEFRKLVSDWDKTWGNSIEADIEELEQKLWNDFDQYRNEIIENFETETDSRREASEVSSRQLSDEIQRNEKTLYSETQKSADRAVEELQTKFEGRQRDLENSKDALMEKERNLDDFLEKERQSQIEGLESQKDDMYQDRMRPLEDKINAVDDEISSIWIELESLYKQQSKLGERLEGLEMEVKELDRQAEFGLLSVISGAIDNANEQGLISPVNDTDSVDLSGKLDISPVGGTE
tara:strand:- start:892 stop:2559 length:1668 start_codon:yes stop_codon:yes gene_type:complete